MTIIDRPRSLGNAFSNASVADTGAAVSNATVADNGAVAARAGRAVAIAVCVSSKFNL